MPHVVAQFCQELGSKGGVTSDQVWRLRARASPTCLAVTSTFVGSDDLPRSRALAALSTVRMLYDVKRCDPVPGSPVARLTVDVGAVRIDRSTLLSGPSGIGDLAADVAGRRPADPVKTPASAWFAALRQVASDPSTYVDRPSWAAICLGGPTLDRSRWSSIQAEVRTSVVRAADEDGVSAPR